MRRTWKMDGGTTLRDDTCVGRLFMRNTSFAARALARSAPPRPTVVDTAGAGSSRDSVSFGTTRS
jgi:hypothetical protein